MQNTKKEASGLKNQMTNIEPLTENTFRNLLHTSLQGLHNELERQGVISNEVKTLQDHKVPENTIEDRSLIIQKILDITEALK